MAIMAARRQRWRHPWMRRTNQGQKVEHIAYNQHPPLRPPFCLPLPRRPPSPSVDCPCLSDQWTTSAQLEQGHGHLFFLCCPVLLCPPWASPISMFVFIPRSMEKWVDAQLHNEGQLSGPSLLVWTY
jgi:hypothetical protein